MEIRFCSQAHSGFQNYVAVRIEFQFNLPKHRLTVQTLVLKMETSPEKLTPENAERLSVMLFSLRDSLVNLSLALKDAQLGASDEDQQETQKAVSLLLGKLKSKIN